jgi:ribose 5-phosphate isomerase RpiB
MNDKIKKGNTMVLIEHLKEKGFQIISHGKVTIYRDPDLDNLPEPTDYEEWLVFNNID